MKIARNLMIVAMCLGGTGTALAHEARSGAMSGPQTDHGRWAAQRHGTDQGVDRGAVAQRRLDALAGKLHLKPAQEEAWNAYSTATLARIKDHLQDREKWMAARAAGRVEKSAPERMEIMARRMRANADEMDKAASDTKTFYAVLSPEQQTIFDLYAHQMRHGRMQRNGRHR